MINSNKDPKFTLSRTSSDWFTCMAFKFLAVSFVIFLSNGLTASEKPQDMSDSFKIHPAELNLKDSHSGQFIGLIGNQIIIGGGLDESGNHSSTVRFRNWTADGDTGWKPIELSIPVAYASAASNEDTLFLIGGLDESGVSRSVTALSFNQGSLTEKSLPDLPVPRIYTGAAILDGTLYVIGGLEEPDSPASRSMFTLDLALPDSGWIEADPIPGVGRIRPTIGVVHDELHVFGGQEITLNGDKGDQVLTLKDSWGYRSVPLDGLTSKGWRKLPELPQPLADAGAIATGQTHLLLLGGYTGDTAYQFPDVGVTTTTSDILVYHNVTDTYVPGGNLPEATAGLVTVKPGDAMLLIEASGNAHSLEIIRTQKSLRMADYSVIFCFLLLMAGIGIYFARKQNTSEEFALGNRKVKWWAAGISMFATGASSISFMAIPAQAYRTNLVWMAPIIFIIPIAILQAYVIFPMLRRLEITSTYEYLSRRFHPALRLVASGQNIMLQLFGRMSVVMLLPAIAISAVTGLDVVTSVLVMGLLTAIYTSLGGFEAVIWTDVIQGFLMLFGAILMIFLAITGLPDGFTQFVDISKDFGKFDMFIWSSDFTLPAIWIFGVSLMLQNLAFASDQPVVQRVFATPLKDVRKLSAMYAFCSITISVVVNIAGIAIFAYFHANPADLDPSMSNDQIIPLYVVQRLPVGIAGLIVAAIFAASMSTLSSSMNSTATIFTEDFFSRIKPNATDKQRLMMLKWGSLGVGVFGTAVAAYMAMQDLESMFKTWNIAVALLGGGFLGIYILGMFSRRANTTGSIVGAVVSIGTTLALKEFSDAHYMLYLPFAVTSCVVVGYTVSLVTPGKTKELRGLTVFDMVKGVTDDDIK